MARMAVAKIKLSTLDAHVLHACFWLGEGAGGCGVGREGERKREPKDGKLGGATGVVDNVVQGNSLTFIDRSTMQPLSGSRNHCSVCTCVCVLWRWRGLNFLCSKLRGPLSTTNCPRPIVTQIMPPSGKYIISWWLLYFLHRNARHDEDPHLKIRKHEVASVRTCHASVS